MRGEIKALTGIRGVAALFVVIYHYFENSTALGIAGPFLRHGYIAVDLFFVLSGFVMSLNYSERFSGRFSAWIYLDFLYKRVGRVAPLYVCVLVATILLSAKQFSMGEMLNNGLMAQGWVTGDTIVGPSWSISTELAAYLLFPALVWMALTPGVLRAWTAGALAVLALVVVSLQSPASLHQIYGGSVVRNGPLDVFETATLYPLLRCLGGFVLGMLAYRLADVPRVSALAKSPAATVLAATTTVLAIAVSDDDVLLVLLFALLVIVLAAADSVMSKLLSFPVIHWLGLVSYSIYLMHRLMQTLLLTPLNDALLARHVPHAFSVTEALLLGLTVPVSAATYYGIERPARDLAHRLIQRRPPPIEAEPSAP